MSRIQMAAGLASVVAAIVAVLTYFEISPSNFETPVSAEDKNGFSVKLERCLRSGESVTCTLSIINRQATRATQLIVPGTFIQAGDSRSFKAVQTVLAGPPPQKRYVQRDLLQDKPASGEFRFEGVPMDVMEIHRFVIQMWARDTQHFAVEFPIPPDAPVRIHSAK